MDANETARQNERQYRITTMVFIGTIAGFSFIDYLIKTYLPLEIFLAALVMSAAYLGIALMASISGLGKAPHLAIAARVVAIAGGTMLLVSVALDWREYGLLMGLIILMAAGLLATYKDLNIK
ncbi:MAG: hypothetical protein HYT50_00965 [Candidatus Wildermuthbacteria bacterium]|nr:hypothetical protein [Candidatus Wildermuthbacteria bacterium]